MPGEERDSMFLQVQLRVSVVMMALVSTYLQMTIVLSHRRNERIYRDDLVDYSLIDFIDLQIGNSQVN
jgi:hypothetical protein